VRVAVAHVDVGALEVVFEHEVDDAADRVRAVHGGRAASDDLDASDRRSRNRVRVDDHRRVDRHAALAVDEHQVAVRAEAAQAQRAGTDRVIRGLLDVGRRELRERWNELRQLVEHFLDADRARVLERSLVDRRDRTVGGEILALNARARDRDFLQGLRLLLRLLRGYAMSRRERECGTENRSTRDGEHRSASQHVGDCLGQ
jgi:hypothetical protein